MKERLLREQSGFTLPEVLVTMVMMITVMFALYSIFDMSLRVFSFSNDKIEAVENARIGMESMEREIRAAYPVDKANGQEHLFWSPGYPTTAAMPSGNSITFGNDLDASRKVECPNSDSQCEEITYTQDGSTLERNGQPAVEFVQNNGLSFDYLKANGTTTTSESEIAMVRVTLVIEVDGRTQTLPTDVALRNRSS